MAHPTHSNPAPICRHSPGERVAVIGAGICGLAHAWCAARGGHQVTLFERDHRARGASVRNFGMVWPIGQGDPAQYQLALRGRAMWLEFLTDAKIWHDPCGAILLAHREDEWRVLQEFHALAGDLGIDCDPLSPEMVAKCSRAAKRQGLLGGLFSRSEMCVDPRQVIRKMPHWLCDRFGVTLEFGTPIHDVTYPSVEAADGRRWQFDRVVIASGADLQTLFPNVLARVGFRLCKLQMLRTKIQPDGWRQGPMLAGGLTLRHYPSFGACPSVVELRDRVAKETPELDRFGIHVMASQNGDGEIVLGDSHEYDDQVDPFDQAEIDELILRELRSIIELPDWTISQRWHGIYPKLAGTVFVNEEIEPQVHMAIPAGGTGMTMSFGIAEQMWGDWDANSAGDEQTVAAL